MAPKIQGRQMMSERHRNASLIAKTAPEHRRQLASRLETETTFTKRNAMGIAPTGGMASQPETKIAFSGRNVVGVTPTGGMALQPEWHLRLLLSRF